MSAPKVWNQLRSLAVRSRKSATWLAAFALCAALSIVAGCGPSKFYRLPLEPAQAHSTFAPIASVSQGMGYQVAQMSDSVNVKYDEETWINFTVQNNAYNMVILISNKNLPPDQAEAKLQAAKSKGDEIWSKAMAARQATLAPVIQAAPPAM